MHAIKKVKKGTYVEIKNSFRTCLIFMIAFMVYEKRAYIDVRYGQTKLCESPKMITVLQSIGGRSFQMIEVDCIVGKGGL